MSSKASSNCLEAAASNESKDPPEDNGGCTSGQNYHKAHKSPRKVQLKEVHHSNETASVQVMTPEGVTLVQTNEKKIHKRRPAPPPPPKQPPRRPPPPPPPVTPPLTQVIIENSQELDSTVPSGNRICPSSPDLPLPPPPTAEEVMIVCDDPLPPPPEGPENVHPRILDGTTLIYPKNSYMSYRSEKKLARQGFDGKYRRSFSTSTSAIDLAAMECNYQEANVFSPNTWEQIHNIRQHGPTVIFHSDSLQQIERLQKSNSQNCILIEDKSHICPDNTLNEDNAENNQSLINVIKQNDDSSNTLHWAMPCRASSQERLDSLIQDSSSDSLQTNSEEMLNCSDSVENFTPANSSSSNCNSIESNLQISANESKVDHNQNSLHGNKIEKLVTDDNLNKNELCNKVITSSKTADHSRIRHITIKTLEELECERLSKEFIQHHSDAEFKNLFVSDPNHKTLTDYMEGLLHLEIDRNSQHNLEASIEKRKFENNQREESQNKEENHSETKSPEVNENLKLDEAEIKAKKEELIDSIDRKLESLRGEQLNIKKEMHHNNILGQEISDKLQELAKPNECEKYALHVEELEKIINLLLSLSGRLARAENNLRNIPKDCDVEEKKILEAKRNKLKEQHEDACRLKECIDRRSNQVTTFLHKYFSDEEYAKYDSFIKRKIKFLIHVREIDEKINLGEEQLAALNVVAQLWKSANS